MGRIIGTVFSSIRFAELRLLDFLELVKEVGLPSLNNLARLPPITVAEPRIDTKSARARNVTATNSSFVSLIPTRSYKKIKEY